MGQKKKQKFFQKKKSDHLIIAFSCGSQCRLNMRNPNDSKSAPLLPGPPNPDNSLTLFNHCIDYFCISFIYFNNDIQ